jgi:hypothetical protein
LVKVVGNTNGCCRCDDRIASKSVGSPVGADEAPPLNNFDDATVNGCGGRNTG